MDKYLMTGEETYKLLAGCGEINCLFKVKSNCTPCARMMKAQHLKSVKAAREIADIIIEEMGAYIHKEDKESYFNMKRHLITMFDKLEAKNG